MLPICFILPTARHSYTPSLCTSASFDSLPRRLFAERVIDTMNRTMALTSAYTAKKARKPTTPKAISANSSVPVCVMCWPISMEKVMTMISVKTYIHDTTASCPRRASALNIGWTMKKSPIPKSPMTRKCRSLSDSATGKPSFIRSSLSCICAIMPTM